MIDTNVLYKAFGEQGEYVRNARVIAELPIEMRKPALQEASQGIGKLLGLSPIHSIYYGEPVYEAFGIRRADAKKHEQADLLLSLGERVSLAYCNNSAISA